MARLVSTRCIRNECLHVAPTPSSHADTLISSWSANYVYGAFLMSFPSRCDGTVFKQSLKHHCFVFFSLHTWSKRWGRSVNENSFSVSLQFKHWAGKQVAGRLGHTRPLSCQQLHYSLHTEPSEHPHQPRSPTVMPLALARGGRAGRGQEGLKSRVRGAQTEVSQTWSCTCSPPQAGKSPQNPMQDLQDLPLRAVPSDAASAHTTTTS